MCIYINLLFSVKRAYHKISLKIHPDRVTDKEKEDATKKFQVLGKAYGILSDKEARKVYDETGMGLMFTSFKWYLCTERVYTYL